MPDSTDIITAINKNAMLIKSALGADAPAFADEYNRLNGAARSATTQAEQDQATADLNALLRRYPLVQQIMAQADPATFGAPAGTVATRAAPAPAVAVAPAPVVIVPTPDDPTPASPAGGPTDPVLRDSLVVTGTSTPSQQIAVEPAVQTASVPRAPQLQPLNAVKESTPMSQIANTPVPTPPPPADGWNGTRFKEWVAAILAVTLVGGTVLLATYAIVSGNAGDNAKNILLLITPLCGVVVGYYFGRIPSEAQAQAATAQAAQATNETARVKAAAADLGDQAAAIVDKAAEVPTSAGPEGATRGLDGGSSPQGLSPSLRQDLRDLQKRARRL